MLGKDEQAASLEAIDKVRQSAANHLGTNRDCAVDFVANLHRAVDRIMQQAGSQMECRIGCANCCSVRVEATEPEIFLIARVIRQLPEDQVLPILERLRNHVAVNDDMRHADCAFLEDKLCSIYEVRPAVCRRAHSLSVERCVSFAPEIPQNLDILLRADVLMKGTAEAYRQVGLQSSAHELCLTVLLALSDETAEERWHSGESVFPEDPA